MHSDPASVREAQAILKRQEGHTYVEPNRHDPESCDACFVIDDICDFHLGISVGFEAAGSLITNTLDNA